MYNIINYTFICVKSINFKIMKLSAFTSLELHMLILSKLFYIT